MDFYQLVSKLQPFENVELLIFSSDVHSEQNMRRHVLMRSSWYDVIRSSQILLPKMNTETLTFILLKVKQTCFH